MTDAAGQSGRLPERRLAVVCGVAAAAVLLASLAVTVLRPSTAESATVLASATRASLVLPDGSSAPAEAGTEVPRGARVVTSSLGAAVLRTRARDVLLGASSEVTVLDGARQRLDRGQVLVDASDGPGLSLDASAAEVAVDDGALTRVERGRAALRVGVFDGATSVRSTGRAGRREVPELFQVQVPYGGLSGTTTPLVLTGDAWEQRYALRLVQDDGALRALVTGLEASRDDAAAVLTAAPAAVRSPAAGSAAPASERLVSYLLATSASRVEGSVEVRYAQVRDYRDDGGSWGVVAALVGSGADDAGRALDAVLSPELQAAPEPGTTFDPDLVLGGPSPTAPTARPTSAGPRPTTSGGPRPTATPTPTTGPDPVTELVDTVVGLLPTPPAPAPVLPAPSAPAPSPGLLGGLVEGLLGAG